MTWAPGQVSAARMDSAPEPQPTSKRLPWPSKSKWERTTLCTRSIIPPPPKAYCFRIHVIQTSKASSAATATENRTPSAAIWNTAKDSPASATDRASRVPTM